MQQPTMFAHDGTTIFYPTAPGRVYTITIAALADCDGSDEDYSDSTAHGGLSDMLFAVRDEPESRILHQFSDAPTGATATAPDWTRWTASWRPWRRPERGCAGTCYPVSTMEKTIKEAAILLGKSPRVLQQMCRDGKVPARREGRGWFVDVSGLVPGGRRRRSAERPPPAEC